MPIYEYKCPNGHVFDVFHGMNDPAPEACEICDAKPVVRVLHPVAVHFKGSGFYTTDYGRGSRKKEQAKEGSSSGGSDGGSSSETKSEPKKAAEA